MGAAGVVLLVEAILRLAWRTRLPTGLWFDEAVNGVDLRAPVFGVPREAKDGIILTMRRLAPSPAVRAGLIDILLLIGLCLLFFWRDVPLAGENYRGFAAGDFANQFYAFARYEAERLGTGHLPLWSPHAFSGHPFIADIQSAVFYPPSLATMLLSAATGFTYAALQREAILHFPFIAVGVYLLARRLFGGRLGALVASVTFTFGGYLTSYPILQLAILEAVAWLPWLLLAVDLAVSAAAWGSWRRASGWAVAGGIALGVSLLAGHPQTTLLMAYAALGFGVFRAWQTGGVRKHWPRFAGLFALTGITAAGLAAVQILPSLQYMQLSTRAAIGIDEAGKGFTPYDLIQFVLPAAGTPVPALYIGLFPLALAVYAVACAAGARVRTAADEVALFLGGAAGLGLLLSWGAITPVYHVFYLLGPGWSLFRQQERVALWVVLALALLAGSGAEALASQWRARVAGDSQGERKFKWSLVVGAALAVLGAVVFFVTFQAGAGASWGFVAATLFAGLVLGLSALALHTRRPVFVVAIIVLDLFTLLAGNHAGTRAGAQPFPPEPYLSAPLADAGQFRIAVEHGLPGNSGYGWDLEETGGASPLSLARYSRFLETLPPERAWQLLNVRYVSTSRAELGAPSEAVANQGNATGESATLYRLLEPAPRAWVTGDYIVDATEAGQLSRLAAPDFDAQQQVVLEAAPDPLPSSPGCTGTVAWQETGPERISLEVESQEPCLLVVSEIAYPGWEARIDGVPAPLLRADSILRAVAVPAGVHDVTMTFSAPLLAAGAMLSGVTLLLAGLWIAVSLSRP